MSPQPWRIKPVLPVTKGLGAVAVPILVFAFGRNDPVQWVMAAAVAIGLAGWALRDVVAPVRLAADTEGVTVMAGYARRRRVPWSAIERVRLDRRDRLGITSELLEIDADDALFLFSMHDLGADPHDVLPVLEELRARHDKDAESASA
jgi:PH (Pleckstrin Homology) domain-containing protein